MEDDQLIPLIKKYLEGNCSSEERLLVESWYAAQKDEKAVVFDGDAQRMAVSAAQSLSSIQAKIAQQQVDATVPSLHKRDYRSYRGWMAAAASILVFLCCGLYFYQNQAKRPVKYSEIVAGKGQVLHLTLADHTSIWLNACSRLRYPVSLESKTREVFLQGEAYFDVHHNPSKPFLVHTSQLTTTVLGTAFSVTAYKDMPAQAVTVIRGKVQVADQRTVLGFLTPNRKLSYNSRSRKGQFSDVSAAAYMSWKDGRLQFENQDMEDIAARLSRWYGYDFRFAENTSKDRQYTASFNNSIPLTNLLAVMKAVSGLGYKINNTEKTVTFLGTDRNQ